MWSTMIFQSAKQIFFPNQPNGWAELDEDVILPTFETVGGNILAPFPQQNVTPDVCSILHAVMKNQIDALCTFCQNCLECSIQSERDTSLKFKANEEHWKVGWNDKHRSLIMSTTQVPFIALFDDISKKLSGSEQKFELDTIQEMQELSFEKEKLVRNLTHILEHATEESVKHFYSTPFFLKPKKGAKEFNFEKYKKLVAEARDKIKASEDYEGDIAAMRL